MSRADPTLQALGLRAMTAPGWRRLPGCQYDTAEIKYRFVTYPDLSQPATIGCLLALVREKWAIPTLAPVCKGGVWMFWAGGLPDALYALRAATEVELLVAALEVPRG